MFFSRKKFGFSKNLDFEIFWTDLGSSSMAAPIGGRLTISPDFRPIRAGSGLRSRSAALQGDAKPFQDGARAPQGRQARILTIRHVPGGLRAPQGRKTTKSPEIRKYFPAGVSINPVHHCSRAAISESSVPFFYFLKNPSQPGSSEV